MCQGRNILIRPRTTLPIALRITVFCVKDSLRARDYSKIRRQRVFTNVADEILSRCSTRLPISYSLEQVVCFFGCMFVLASRL